MKSEAFTKIMQFIFEREGGYVNHPADPGGATNYGITQRTLDRYNAKHGLPKEDVKDLKKVKAIDIYEEEYWDPAWDKISFELAACMMDTSVLSGRARADRLRKNCNEDYVVFLQLRGIYFMDITKTNPKLNVFFDGWMNRNKLLRRFIDENRGVPV